MTLRELMGDGAPEVAVSGLAYSTQSVTPGTLFFCVPGFRVDGHDFAPQAVERGAVALVCQRPLGLGVPEIVVPDVRAAMGPAAARFNGDPTSTLDVVGITGTNGKTTTAFLVRHLLEADGRATGLLGTVKQVVGGVGGGGRAHHPGGDRPPGHLPADARGGRPGLCDGGVLPRPRARSRGGNPLRLPGVHQPHPGSPGLPSLDGGLLRGQAAAVRGARAGGGERGRPVGQADRRGCPGHDLRHRPRRRLPGPRRALRPHGLRVHARGPRRHLDLRSPLPGLFNVQNVLGAVAAARALGVPMDTIAAALPGFGRVPGRFEPVDEGQDFGVLVDYAHTPDSLENVLRAAREITGGTAAGGVRRRRRPRPGQAPADGRRRPPPGRPGHRDLGQSAERGSRPRSWTR